MSAVLVVAILALAGGGCAAPRDTVTEGDRQVNYQTLGAADVAMGRLEAIEDLGPMGPLVQIVEEAKAAVLDIRENAAHLQTVHGPPENPKPWSPDESKKARELSTTEHANLGRGFWGWLLGGAGLLGAAAWAFFKTTVAGQAVDVLVKAGQRLREKATAGTLTADDVKGTLKEVVAIAPASVKAKIESTLTRVKAQIPAAIASVDGTSDVAATP